MRGLTAAIVLAGGLAAPAAQDPAPAPAPPSIVAVGHGMVRRAPDVAFIRLAVESRAKSSRDAQRQSAESMAVVNRRLVAAGVPRDSLKTLGLSLDRDYDNIGGRRVARDFVARNTLEVQLDDVARVGEIADAAVESGATSLGDIRFDVKDRAGAEREAVRLAVVDARGRAEAMAAGAGRSVDRVLKIEDVGAEELPRPMARLGGVRAEAVAVSAVEPGFIEIRAQIVLTVSIK